MIENDLIQYNNLGYSDKECLSQLQTLKKVMFATDKVKYGRGRNVHYKQEFRFKGRANDEIRKRITISIKHYEKKIQKISGEHN